MHGQSLSLKIWDTSHQWIRECLHELSFSGWKEGAVVTWVLCDWASPNRLLPAFTLFFRPFRGTELPNSIVSLAPCSLASQSTIEGLKWVIRLVFVIAIIVFVRIWMTRLPELCRIYVCEWQRLKRFHCLFFRVVSVSRDSGLVHAFHACRAEGLCSTKLIGYHH